MSNRVNMKDLLGEGLFKCMEEKSFEKITIKQICNKTGVIRGTFYNHFVDKYEALEYLVYSMFVDDIDKYHTEEDFVILLKQILKIIYDKQEFFSKCFFIEGQNGFETILNNIFNSLFERILCSNYTIDKEFICSYYANTMVFVIKDWNKHCYNKSIEEMYKISYILLLSNIKNFMEKEN